MAEKFLNGQGPRLDFQVGVGSHSSDDVISYNSGHLSSGIESLGVAEALINSKVSAQSSLSAIDSANSRIRDVDYAEETSKHARNSIITSASAAVLAQANISGKAALKPVE